MNCQLKETPGYGRCCCNCRWQMIAVCHPWNKTFAKGSTTEILGYLCAVPDFSIPNAAGESCAVFFDDPHGMCEMHGHKDDPTLLINILKPSPTDSACVAVAVE